MKEANNNVLNSQTTNDKTKQEDKIEKNQNNKQQQQREIINVSNILDNYEIVNTNYTKGIEITQCTFSGSHHFSIWEFSGYEPYQLFYDHFLSDCDSTKSIHLIVYDLNQSLIECYDECIYWLEYLRARLTKSTITTKTKILFIATHADLDHKSTYKKDGDGGYLSNMKAEQLKIKLDQLYENDAVFDLGNEAHFVLDSRAAWTPDMKHLIEYLIRLKQNICESLPRCTTFLNRSLKLIQNWRKQSNQPQQLNNSFSGSSFNLNNSTNNFNSTTSTSSTTPTSPISVPSTPTTNAVFFQKASASMQTLNYHHHHNHYPIINSKQFVDSIREHVNPLASDEHLNELLYQLKLMGEIVYLKSSGSGSSADVSGSYDDLICYQPEWLCGKILGRLFAHERYMQIKPHNLNGFYSYAELKELYADLCTNIDLIVQIFLSFDLCAELEPTNFSFFNNSPNININSNFVYEFPAFNFLSEPMPLSFHTIKSAFLNSSSKNLKSSTSIKSSSSNFCFVFNGFRLFMSNFHLNNNNNNNNLNYVGQLANIFFKIQSNLRNLANNNDFNDYQLPQSIEIEDNLLMTNKNATTPTTTSHTTRPNSLLQHVPKINSDNAYHPPLTPLVLNSPTYTTTTTSTSISFSANTTTSILATPPLLSSPNSALFSNQNNYDEQQNHKSFYSTPNKTTSTNQSLIDLEIYQTRYCTRLKRKMMLNCSIECLVSLEHLNGDFIEIKACAPEKYREELFYFVDDLYKLIERVVHKTCPNINIEKHYLHFNPVNLLLNNHDMNNNLTINQNCAKSAIHLGVIEHESVLRPKELVKFQYESTINRLKLVDLVCCGSELIEKNLSYGIDLPISDLSSYAKQILCSYLDKTDPMGRDWSILGFLLGLQDFLPKLDEAISSSNSQLSKCNLLLNEWYRRNQPEHVTIRILLQKIKDLGRMDVHDMIISTLELFRLNISKDSGIQNSNQTLASLK
jgi:hypothetical protein